MGGGGGGSSCFEDPSSSVAGRASLELDALGDMGTCIDTGMMLISSSMLLLLFGGAI